MYDATIVDVLALCTLYYTITEDMDHCTLYDYGSGCVFCTLYDTKIVDMDHCTLYDYGSGCVFCTLYNTNIVDIYHCTLCYAMKEDVYHCTFFQSHEIYHHK